MVRVRGGSVYIFVIHSVHISAAVHLSWFPQFIKRRTHTWCLSIYMFKVRICKFFQIQKMYEWMLLVRWCYVQILFLLVIRLLLCNKTCHFHLWHFTCDNLINLHTCNKCVRLRVLVLNDDTYWQVTVCGVILIKVCDMLGRVEVLNDSFLWLIDLSLVDKSPTIGLAP